MQRVLVVGGPGSGKLTFARRLGALTNLPVTSLDALFWEPGWQESDRGVFQNRLQETIQSPAWILDGNYLVSTNAPQLPMADTVFWLDIPTMTRMTGIFSRIAYYYGRVRPEMPEGCAERLDWAFIRYALNYQRKQRPKLVAVLEQLRPDQKLVHFTRRRDVSRYLSDFDASRQGLARAPV